MRLDIYFLVNTNSAICCCLECKHTLEVERRRREHVERLYYELLNDRLTSDIKAVDSNSSGDSPHEQHTIPHCSFQNCIFFVLPTIWSPSLGKLYLTVRVDDVKLDDSGEYALYRISGAVENVYWETWRRYKEFRSVDARLRSFLKISCPPLPSTTWFRCLDSDYLEERRSNLEEYLHEILLIDNVLLTVCMRKFLGLLDVEAKL